MGITGRGVPPNCQDQNGDIPASAQPNPGPFRLSLSLCQAEEPVTLNIRMCDSTYLPGNMEVCVLAVQTA